MRRILFRADGDSKIGLGHVIRSCALADILRDEFNCIFCIRQPSAYVKEEIHKAGCELFEMPLLESYEDEQKVWSQLLKGDEIVVLDGYSFNKAYQQQIKSMNCRLVCIDDIHASSFLADIIINHSESARISDYDAPPFTQYFLGAKYSLLRKPFRTGRLQSAKGNELLICLGGADPANETKKVWKKAVDAGFTTIHVLIGDAYRFRPDLEDIIRNHPAKTFIYHCLSAEEVAELMQRCAYAILSPSSVAIEYMSFSGVVFLHQIADNQKHLKKYFVEAGLAKDLSALSFLREEESYAMLEKQKQVFDNQSSRRLLTIFRSLSTMMQVTVSNVSLDDMHLTYCWANDPLTRQMSYSAKPIQQEEHNVWFQAKLKDHACYYYVIKVGSRKMAQIRFDRKKSKFLISYLIDPAFRGMGLGSFILAEGIRQLQKDSDTEQKQVVGYVKRNNIPSCQSFEKLKFQKEETDVYENSFKYTLLI